MIARRVDQMGSHVFISYATEDQETADAVCKALEARNIACWMAKRDLPPGFVYLAPLADAIDDSLAVILILSSHANESPYVLREINRAVNHRISLLVFRIEDIWPSKNLEFLVDVTQRLDGFEASYASHIDRLADSVSTLLADRDEADASREQARPPVHWAHQTTEDENYVEPREALEWLNAQAADPKVGVMAVTGMGGIGKTAIVAHWLKRAGGDLCRPCCGIFYWSFDADRSVDVFLSALRQFAERQLQRSPSDDLSDLLAALRLLQTQSLILVLDGLEVHQQGPREIGCVFGDPGPANPQLHILEDWAGTAVVGSLKEERLRELLETACDEDRKALVVVTSREKLVDLSSHSGEGYQYLDSGNLKLTDDQGAWLLRACGVRAASVEELREVNRRWQGHPLGLRLFAGAVKRAGGGLRQSHHLSDEEGAPGEKEPNSSARALQIELLKLVSSYERRLTPVQKGLLGVVSLSRTPVDLNFIKMLSERIPSVSRDLDGLSDEQLRLELRALCDEHLLVWAVDDEAENGGPKDTYLCHPILRDHFARYLRRRGLEAESLIGPGGNEGLSHLNRLKLALVAIEALLDAGDLSRADEVFRTHLDDGRLLLETDDFEVGRNCVLEFVRDEQRQQECIEKLSEARLVYYLRMAGLLLLLVGDAEEAKRYHDAATEHTTCAETLQVLLNHALIWTFTGDSHKGECVARAALKMASKRDDTEGMQHSLSCLAHALSLQGKTSEAEERYKEADALAARKDLANKTLSGPDAVLWALHLLRTERTSQARSLIEHELHFARRRKAPRRGDENLPRCQWVLGCVEIAKNNPDKAMQCLSTAESTLRKQGALLLLPFVLHAKADARRRLKDWSDAIQSCEQGLDLAAKRRLILGQAELLILSGRIQLEQVPAKTESGKDSREWQIGQAMGDAECGLKLAGDHKYLWLVRDALLVLAEGAEAQKDAKAAANYRREANSLARHLLPWRRPPPN